MAGTDTIPPPFDGEDDGGGDEGDLDGVGRVEAKGGDCETGVVDASGETAVVEAVVAVPGASELSVEAPTVPVLEAAAVLPLGDSDALVDFFVQAVAVTSDAIMRAADARRTVPLCMRRQ